MEMKRHKTLIGVREPAPGVETGFKAPVWLRLVLSHVLLGGPPVAWFDALSLLAGMGIVPVLTSPWTSIPLGGPFLTMQLS